MFSFLNCLGDETGRGFDYEAVSAVRPILTLGSSATPETLLP